MFKRILIPLDLSERSLRMLDALSQLQRFGAQEAILLHVTDGQELSAEQKAILNKVRRGLRSLDLAIRSLTVPGEPVAEILSAAEREDASLIALVSAGKGKGKELLVGSTSLGVLRSSARPMLILKPAESASAPMLRRALVPMDLSDPRSSPQDMLSILAVAGLEEAVLFHVVESDKHNIEDDARFNKVRAQLEEQRSQLAVKGCIITTHVHFGTVSYNILEAARELDASLIVLTSHQRTRLGKDSLGGSLEEVVRRSPVTVLVVPGAT